MASETSAKGGGGRKASTKAKSRKSEAKRIAKAKAEGRWDDIWGEFPF